jgi:PAS domain S-box-containing protein
MTGGDDGMDMDVGSVKDVKQLDKEDFNLIQSIQNSQQCFVITDPSLHDNPIVYASNDFLDLTGYSQEEVLGRNCRFLQGTETSQEKVAVIRKAISVGEDCNVTLVNYTSSGKPFWNSLFIAALRDAENNIVNFIGVIVKVAGPEPGDAEYGKVLSS